MAALIDHLASRLGELKATWPPPNRAPAGAPEIGYFVSSSEDEIAVSTIGLSATGLTARTNGQELRLEFLMCAHPAWTGGAGPLPDVIEYVVGMMLGKRQAMLRGDFMRLPAPLLPGSQMNALYAAHPVIYDDGFSEVLLEDGVEANIVWLIPVGAAEVDFIIGAGWGEFEQRLADADVDLLDLHREQLVLAPH